MMVADTLITAEGTMSYNRKVFRASNGDIVGLSGTYADSLEFFRWYDAGREGPCPEGEHETLVLTTEGKLFEWYSGKVIPVSEEFTALGTGAEACIMAMLCGRTPKQAVALCKKIRSDVGGRSHVMRL